MRKIFSSELSSMASFKMFRSKYASTEFDFVLFLRCLPSRWALLHTVSLGRMAIHKNLPWGLVDPVTILSVAVVPGISCGNGLLAVVLSLGNQHT